ncbi:hypothetical protein H0H81_007064 [Sphagnurus paluster]|uniref:Uncharacterized protein n=1 Tax=Sphagnurus paluster TaxID=117069 RepID=A0A9P7KDV2_9AGAR|nr:hypothetical protein H0H81_007064 [Sphagnurus paluster]
MDPAHFSRPPSVPAIVAEETDSSEIKAQTIPYASRVDITALDPVGIQELSKNSVAQEEAQHSFSSSNATLTGIAAGEGPFDFARTLQTIV